MGLGSVVGLGLVLEVGLGLGGEPEEVAVEASVVVEEADLVEELVVDLEVDFLEGQQMCVQ